MSYIFSLANRSDDMKLQKIISENPMQGKIGVSFQRHPSFFRSVEILGKHNQVVTAKENNDIIGFGIRSIKPVYVNGKVADIGYLSGLRIAEGHRNSIVLAKGYRFLKILHQDKKVQLYISTIVADNDIAKNTLTSGRAGLPAYHNIGDYYTFVIPITSRKNIARIKCPDIRIMNAEIRHMKEIIKFINLINITKQFAPFHSVSDVIHNKNLYRDLNPRDFYIAIKQESIVGVIAKWDQRKYKQNVVVGYSGALGILRPFYNLMCPLIGFPSLPRVGSEINSFYGSFVAVIDNNPEILSLLLEKLHNDNSGKDYNYFMIGLHSQDPLNESLKGWRYVRYDSYLYAVYWDDGAEFFKTLDERVPYLELGLL